MKYLKQILLFLFLLPQIVIAQLKPLKINIGASLGYMQYYAVSQSTYPELVFFKPDIFESPDLRNFQVFAELESARKFSVTLGFGYKEIWNGHSITVYPEIGAGFTSYSDVGAYLFSNLKAGYVFKMKRFEIIPALGGSIYFSDDTAEYMSLTTIGGDIIVGPFITRQLRRSFFTI